MRLLLVDDDEGIKEGWKRVFEGEGWKVTTAESEKEAEGVIRRESPFDVAVVDMCLSPEDTKGEGGLKVIGLLEKKNIFTQVIAITAYMDEEKVVKNTIYKAMKFGIYQYMDKKMENFLEKLLKEVENV